MRVEGLTVAVTGAMRGIGRVLVDELLRRGATVLAVARDATALDALALAAPGRVRAVPVDLAVRARYCNWRGVSARATSTGSSTTPACRRKPTSPPRRLRTSSRQLGRRRR